MTVNILKDLIIYIFKINEIPKEKNETVLYKMIKYLVYGTHSIMPKLCLFFLLLMGFQIIKNII